MEVGKVRGEGMGASAMSTIKFKKETGSQFLFSIFKGLLKYNSLFQLHMCMRLNFFLFCNQNNIRQHIGCRRGYENLSSIM